MPETDILNPDVRWDRTIDDSIGPDYGWEILRDSQLAIAKPAGGAPQYRLTGNAGHTATLSWLNRSRKCVEKLKQWAEQHEDGYFTIIDHDGGGRHYVGTFVGSMPRSQAGNDRFNIQGWQFVETPGAPMLQYPGDWEHWAVQLAPFADNGTLRCAVVGNWMRSPGVVQDDGTTVQPYSVQNTPAAGDSVTFEYRGYGLRIWANQGPSYGTYAVTLDGVAKGNLATVQTGELGSQVVFELAEIPLDIHRVTLTLTGALKPLVLTYFEVMR